MAWANLLRVLTLAAFGCVDGFMSPSLSSSKPVARSAHLPRRSHSIMEKKEPDVYDEASAQQLPQLKLVAIAAVVYIGGQVLLGEDGTREAGRWLREGPFGPIWTVLSEPLVKPKDLVRKPSLNSMRSAIDLHSTAYVMDLTCPLLIV